MFFSSRCCAVAGVPATDTARAATMPMGMSFFTCFVLSLFSVLANGDWRRARATDAADQRDDAVDRRQADQAVDDAAGGVRLAELETKDPRDEVELRDGDETPVEAADDQERGGEQIELSHCCTPPV